MIDKISKFMYGRYGMDELSKFLLKVYIALAIINVFVDSSIISALGLIIFAVVLYRFCSKNCYKRRKENNKYFLLKKSLLLPFKNIKRNIKDKDYIYKKCFKCKTILKLPLPMKRGIKHAKCPKCKKRLTIFTLRKQKVEIIKQNKK